MEDSRAPAQKPKTNMQRTTGAWEWEPEWVPGSEPELGTVVWEDGTEWKLERVVVSWTKPIVLGGNRP